MKVRRLSRGCGDGREADCSAAPGYGDRVNSFSRYRNKLIFQRTLGNARNGAQ